MHFGGIYGNTGETPAMQAIKRIVRPDAYAHVPTRSAQPAGVTNNQFSNRVGVQNPLKADEFRHSRPYEKSISALPLKGEPLSKKVVTTEEGKALVVFDHHGHEATRIVTSKDGRSNYSQAIKYTGGMFSGEGYVKYMFDSNGEPIEAIRFSKDNNILNTRKLPKTFKNGSSANLFDVLFKDGVSIYSR